MGLPNILIEFKTKAGTVINRGSRGVVAVIVNETTKDVYSFDTITDVPNDVFSAENKAYIERAFIGGIKPVKKVIVVSTDTVTNGLAEVEKHKFDYLVGPHNISEDDATLVATTIKAMRDNKDMKVKAILPNISADHEGIINFTTNNIVVGDNTYTTAQYCSRIAGLLAGTPLQESATYKVLSEVKDVPKFTKSELDTKINNGELVLFWDGEKVKVGRGVNSLVTIGSDKTADMKSLKVIDIMDMIYTDIKDTCEDNYTGKFINNYDNKCNLVVAIKSYLENLKREGLLDGDINVGIDMQSQKDYLQTHGIDIEAMKDIDIKKGNTGTNVFLQGKYKIANAIEDISIKFYV